LIIIIKSKLRNVCTKNYNKYLLVGSISKMKGCNLYLKFGVEVTLIMRWYLFGYDTKLMKVNEHIGDHCNLISLLWNSKASFFSLYFVPKEINQMFIVL
jgi:hypothetical protein